MKSCECDQGLFLYYKLFQMSVTWFAKNAFVEIKTDLFKGTNFLWSVMEKNIFTI